MGKTASRARLRSAPVTPDAAPGYAPSGASEFSRFAAGNAQARGLNEPPPEHPLRWRTCAEQIARVSRELKKIEGKLKAGGLSHERVAKLSSDVDIKTRFLTRLRTEQAEIHRRGACDV